MGDGLDNLVASVERGSNVSDGGWVLEILGRWPWFGSLRCHFAACVHVWPRGYVVLYVVACLLNR